METKTETLKLKVDELPPENFTGIVEYPLGTKIWFQDGFPHRVDGPAIEYYSRNYNSYYVDGNKIPKFSILESVHYIFLKREMGKYNLEWVSFLTETGIQQYPIVPGMEKEEYYQLLFVE